MHSGKPTNDHSVHVDPQDDPRYSGDTNEDLEQTVIFQVKGNVSSSVKKKPVPKPAPQPQE